MADWYVVYTHPREEIVAEQNLKRQGFSVYWPRYRKRSSHARRVQDVPSSLFPRYLFAEFDPHAPASRAIRSTRGVIDVVRQGNEPVAVGAALIEQIREREDECGFVVLGRQIELHKGQRIGLKGDAFRGHNLIFEAKKDSDRVVALLNLLGREFEISIPLQQIVLAQ